jgi:probable HAF family extracellular repeat protein
VYHVTYLGFAFGNGIEAKINNLGQITGSDGSKGFVYDGGQITTLGTLGSPMFGTRPDAINDTGEVAGFSLTAALAQHAFLYTSGPLKDLGALPGFPNSQALSINAAGDVVGASFSANGASSLAFLYHNNTLTDLGSGTANAINASGTIVGTSGNRAVLYENGTVIDLGNFGDSSLTTATDINNLGQIVGSSYVKSGSVFLSHPFLYESGVWHDLGLPAGVPLGIPSAINNLGQVVGNSNLSLGSNDRPPFLYTDGTIYNLQSLLDSSGAGISLQLAYDINDSGTILAQGHNNLGYQAVLLTPVPEPGALMLAGIAFAFIVASRIRVRWSSSRWKRC